jgi:hypothetical protein
MFGHSRPHNRYLLDNNVEYFDIDQHNSKYSIQILKHGSSSMSFWSPTNDWWQGRSMNMLQDDKYREFKRNGYVYYAVPHNSEYKVKMHNGGDLRVDATLKIDGIDMGTWRIEPYSTITIERPADNNRKFTFVREGSWQGNMGGVEKGKFDNGLIEVTFVPEHRSSGQHLLQRAIYSDSIPMSNNISQKYNFSTTNDSYSTGGTVLGDDSSQRFSNASYLSKDYSKKVTKRVRLVVEENRKPYVPLGSVSRGSDDLYDDPVPPRIFDRPERMDRPEWIDRPDRFDRSRLERFDRHCSGCVSDRSLGSTIY